MKEILKSILIVTVLLALLFACFILSNHKYKPPISSCDHSSHLCTENGD